MLTPTILGLGTAVPELAFTQEEIYRLCGYRDRKIEAIFQKSGIETRRLYFDTRTPTLPETADEMHARYLRGAVELGLRAARGALEDADLPSERVGLIVAASCTGYLCPDLATRLVGPLELRPDAERAGLQGMGCGGAMPALQRASDFVKARGRHALVIAAEVCSAAYFLDGDAETAVGNALCGDGAAAAVLGPASPTAAAGSPRPRIEQFCSRILPEHLEKVGFSQREGRLRIILHERIADLAPPLIHSMVEETLRGRGLGKEEIAYWILHPGGRRIVETLPQTLGLSPDRLQASFEVLREYGNLSSPTVLFVLERALQRRKPSPGDSGLMLALGPGLAAEAAFLSW